MTILTIIAAIGGLLALGALGALLWLGRSLNWATLDEEEPQAGQAHRRDLPVWLTDWLKPPPDPLTRLHDRTGR